MRINERKNYPYPILLENGGDYKQSSFTMNVLSASVNDEENNLNIKYNYEIKCPYIEKIISENKAIEVILIMQKTFRKMIQANKEIIISINELTPNCNIELQPMVIAKEDFSLVYDESMDDVFSYFEEDFEIKKYQILGYGTHNEIEIPNIEKISSIFTLSKLKDKNEIKSGKPYIISLSSNTIDIKVQPKIYDSFTMTVNNQQSFKKILYSCFVYPAVQMAILSMTQNESSDLLWQTAIRNKILQEKNTDIVNLSDLSYEDIIEYTNVILSSLLEDAFENIKTGED